MDDDPLPTLPALRGLSKLADMRPCLVVDTREKLPFKFTRLPFVVDTLQTGDYSIRGCEHRFCIERKSLDDFVGCCKSDSDPKNDKRATFERELIRARGYEFACIVIVATDFEIDGALWRSDITSKAVRATMDTFKIRYIPIELVPTPEAGALLIEKLAWRFAREIVTAANDLLRGSTPNL